MLLFITPATSNPSKCHPKYIFTTTGLETKLHLVLKYRGFNIILDVFLIIMIEEDFHAEMLKYMKKAEMVKLVDTQASGACRGNPVEVRILFSAYLISIGS